MDVPARGVLMWKPYEASESLMEYAARFPQMDGVKVGPWLMKESEQVREGEGIIEVGPWLGAGTAYLSMGLINSRADVTIDCYDRFEMVESEQKKAQAFGVEMPVGTDTLPWVKNALRPFRVDVSYHKGDIREFEYYGLPIALYVDDACKSEKLWQHAMDTFRPCFIPGQTVLFLMDYFYFEKAGEAYGVQRDYMAKHPEFELLESHVGGTSCGIFRYNA